MEGKPLVIPLTLKGDNYLLWARVAKTNLRGKSLWTHIEPRVGARGSKEASGKAKDKSNEEELTTEEEKWLDEDQLVLAAIQNSLELPILQGYSYCETAKELWDTLKVVYGNVSNLTRVYEVKKALNKISQGDMEFKKHFGIYRALIAELDLLRPSTMDPKVILERKEQDNVFGLLMSLNGSYNDLVKHILRGSSLPNLDDVCSQIQKEQGTLGLVSKEELYTAHKAEAPNATSAAKETIPAANKVEFKRDFERRPMLCDHCKKPGHKKAQCWFLHPHLRPSREGNGGSSNRYNNSRDNNNQNGYNPRAHFANEASNNGDMLMKKSDVEALFQAMTSKMNSGISLFSHLPLPNAKVIVDSGASHHMISNHNMLMNIKPSFGNVQIANGDRIQIKGMGELSLFDKKTDAFYIPNFTSNLLSVKKATKDLNCRVIFSPNEVQFQDIESGKLIGKGGTEDELYVLKNLSSSLHSNVVSNVATSFNVMAVDVMWHARLGHPHSRALEILFPKVKYDSTRCEACILGKHCKSVFPTSQTIYEKPFDLIHSDVWTSPHVSRDNHKYFVTFIDEKSKYTWITLLPSKDRVFEAFQNFQNYVTNQFNAKIKLFRSDNGGEYTSHAFKAHLAKHGIVHQTSCPYTPQQNGVAERKNRHLMEVARSMMYHHNVPKRFWSDAVMTACYLINRIPTKVLDDSTPYEVLNSIRPSLNHLRVFGCLCFVLCNDVGRNKLDSKSTRCVFLGYSTTQRGYKCYDPAGQRVLVSRDVKFMEEKGYYTVKDWEGLKDINTTTDRAASLRFILEHLGNGTRESHETRRTDRMEGQEEGISGAASSIATPEAEEANNQEEVISGEPHGNEEMVENHEQPDENIAGMEEVSNVQEEQRETATRGRDMSRNSPRGTRSNTTSPFVPRRSGRIRYPPVRYPPEHWTQTRVYYNNQAVAHPIQEVCSLDLLPKEHRAFLTKIEAHAIPQSYEEAQSQEVWNNAVKEEVGAMTRNNTWEEEDLPPGKRCVDSKWVFTIKYRSNGDIERYKARLVARGFTQTYGEDYMDTFAPVAKQHTVKVVLSLATNLEWDLWQMDVKNAFLQGELEEEVYMTPPPGLEDSISQGKVLRLRKAIYGLKQSPRAWYHKLSTTLIERGFKRSEADHTLFTHQDSNGIVVVLIYVDDLIISGNNKGGIIAIKQALHSVFDIKDLGELKYFLGIEVCRSKEGLFLSQRKYTLDLLNCVGKLGAKPAKTPLESGYKVNREGEKDDTPFKDVAQYRRMVGKLIYLTYTRPDISFAVNQVSQHMQNPTVYHWSLIERILRYLKNSPGQGIWMGKNKNTEIVGYCDADWAGDRNDRKSTTGYCTFVGGNLVTWKTKKQKVVSCSSAEAEYRAMRKLLDELIWLKALLKDMGIEHKDPMTMHCDNQAAIHIATNPVFHERTKHIEMDCHRVRGEIENGVILPCYTRSQDQLADIFTKAASIQVCDHIHKKLGLVDLTHP